jgi:membrane-bound metal-dependent hydrolase YbcI (DUF457 family)
VPLRLDKATDWVVRFSRNRWGSLTLIAAIVAVDAVLLSRSFGFAARALMDEPCHLATAVIVLGTITRWRGHPPSRPFIWSMLFASVAIDVDHLPAEFGHSVSLYGNLPRPYTHALWLVMLLAVIAVVAYRRSRVPGRARAAMAGSVFAGLAWGLAAHFLRDVATAPISLLWPVSGVWLQVPYGWYLGVMLAAVALPVSGIPRAARGWRPGHWQT